MLSMQIYHLKLDATPIPTIISKKLSHVDYHSDPATTVLTQARSLIPNANI